MRGENSLENILMLGKNGRQEEKNDQTKKNMFVRIIGSGCDDALGKS